MYDYQIEDVAQEQLLRLPYEAVVDFVDTVALICIDPWNFQREPDEPLDDHHAHRTASFGAGGMLTFLILEHAAEVHVTRIVWLG